MKDILISSDGAVRKTYLVVAQWQHKVVLGFNGLAIPGFRGGLPTSVYTLVGYP